MLHLHRLQADRQIRISERQENFGAFIADSKPYCMTNNKPRIAGLVVYEDMARVS